MEEESKGMKNWYDKNYKKLLIIPALMLILSIGYLWNFTVKNNDIIYKDVSLTGGTTVSVFDSNVSIKELRISLITEFPDLNIRGISDFRTGEQIGFFVETKEEPEKITTALENYLGYELNSENSGVEFSGSNLSEGFYNQLRFAILIASTLMAMVVFIIFRTFIPSFAVILSAFADIVMTIALVDIIGIQLSTAGVIAFLMLIGYSVDTDILLTSRLLKDREESVNKTLIGAFKTGITMTLTSVAAVIISLAIIYNLSDSLKQIFTVLTIGLGFDIMNTWITNASLLKWYLEKK